MPATTPHSTLPDMSRWCLVFVTLLAVVAVASAEVIGMVKR